MIDELGSNLKDKKFFLLIFLSIFIINKFVSGIGFLGTYLIQPIIWILFVIFIFKYSKKRNIKIFGPGKRYIRRAEMSPVQISILIGTFQISISIIVGLFVGFGKSPYSFTPIMILTNIFFLISSISFLETSRTFFIRVFSKRKNEMIIIGLIAVLYSFFATYNKIFSVNSKTDAVQLLGTFFSTLSQNILATYMAYLGGALASISYMGMIQGFEFFMPYLPKLSWELQTFLGILAPTIGFMATQNLFEEKKSEIIKKEEDISPGWIVIGIMTVSMIWIFSGILGFYPTVVGSGSMRPSIDTGDIAIIVNAKPEDIKVGDVIQIKYEYYNVLHRVIDIEKIGDTLYFKTKGDDNEATDKDLAEGKQVMGKMAFTIPKIGLTGIYLRNGIQGAVKLVFK